LDLEILVQNTTKHATTLALWLLMLLRQQIICHFLQVSKFALVAKTIIGGESVMLVKPTTYMNDSGKAVRAILDYYDGDVDDDISIG
jgi:peptidyl-tRNA hydrolase